jgi:hypothetical protein
MALLRFASCPAGENARDPDFFGDLGDLLVDLPLVLGDQGLLRCDIGKRLLDEDFLLSAGLAGRFPREERRDAKGGAAKETDG